MGMQIEHGAGFGEATGFSYALEGLLANLRVKIVQG